MFLRDSKSETHHQRLNLGPTFPGLKLNSNISKSSCQSCIKRRQLLSCIFFWIWWWDRTGVQNRARVQSIQQLYFHKLSLCLSLPGHHNRLVSLLNCVTFDSSRLETPRPFHPSEPPPAVVGADMGDSTACSQFGLASSTHNTHKTHTHTQSRPLWGI